MAIAMPTCIEQTYCWETDPLYAGLTDESQPAMPSLTTPSLATPGRASPRRALLPIYRLLPFFLGGSPEGPVGSIAK
jgi:hypothetical protein